MPIIWYKQAYVQGFDCESITLKKLVNMFERKEISESIHQGVVEPSYKKLARADANCTGNSRHKRGESTTTWTRP